MGNEFSYTPLLTFAQYPNYLIKLTKIFHRAVIYKR